MVRIITDNDEPPTAATPAAAPPSAASGVAEQWAPGQARIRRRRRALARTGPEPAWPEDNPRARRYTEWIVANRPMPAMMRLVLRVVLLHMDATMQRSCTASIRTLAHKASLSPRRVSALLHAAERAGIVRNCGAISFLPTFDDATEAYLDALGTLWNSGKQLGKEWCRTGMRLPRADDALLRLREPELFLDDDDGVSDEEAALAYALAREAIVAQYVSPFFWIRALVDAPAFARPTGLRRRARSRTARIKAVAFAVNLLVNSRGLPYRWTTVKEVATLAGYDDLDGVRAALRDLEHAGWLRITRRHGQRGGLLLALCAPEDSVHGGLLQAFRAPYADDWEDE